MSRSKNKKIDILWKGLQEQSYYGAYKPEDVDLYIKSINKRKKTITVTNKKPKVSVQQNYKFEHIHEGVVCLCCGKVMISYHRHDYKTCGCPQSSMVDGGQVDYVRTGGQDLNLVRAVKIIPVLFIKNGKQSKKKLKTYREVFSRKTITKAFKK